LLYNIWINSLIIQNCPSALNISKQNGIEEKKNKKGKGHCAGAQVHSAYPAHLSLPVAVSARPWPSSRAPATGRHADAADSTGTVGGIRRSPSFPPGHLPLLPLPHPFVPLLLSLWPTPSSPFRHRSRGHRPRLASPPCRRASPASSAASSSTRVARRSTSREITVIFRFGSPPPSSTIPATSVLLRAHCRALRDHCEQTRLPDIFFSLLVHRSCLLHERPSTAPRSSSPARLR
jgi:hypothetical protein